MKEFTLKKEALSKFEKKINKIIKIIVFSMIFLAIIPMFIWGPKDEIIVYRISLLIMMLFFVWFIKVILKFFKFEKISTLIYGSYKVILFDDYLEITLTLLAPKILIKFDQITRIKDTSKFIYLFTGVGKVAYIRKDLESFEELEAVIKNILVKN